MSDSDKPQTPPPAEQAPQQPAEQAQGEKYPKLSKLLRRESRQEKREKPVPGGKVPGLDERDLGYGFGKKAELFDAELERDLETDVQAAMAGISDSDMQQLFGEQRSIKKQPGQGGPKKGKVISIRGKDVFIDVGGRTQGVLPLMQFEEGPPKVGDEVEVAIEGYDPDGFLLLTRQGAVVEADWSSVTAGMIVEARVTGTNKGGLEVDVNGIRGFMPVSQIDLYRVEDLEQFVNQRLRCVVAEVDREERNLVVSRRALLQRDRDDAKEKFWAEAEEAQIREGIVRSVKDFGAFIDLGGADGLLPVGEMSWTRVKHPSDMLAVGQKVRVVILRLDREARKMTLGLKQLTDSPWDQAALNYPAGSTVTGKVTRTAEFGAFVEVEPGVEGLIHVSELSPQRVRRVTDVVQVGQEVSVRVLSLDAEAQRMSLSLKQAIKAAESEEEEDESEAPAPAERKRTTPLRGGVGEKAFPIPKPGEGK